MSSTKAIEQFLRPPSEGGAYTDERLAMLLAHAEDGRLTYFSCCCLIGIPTADHALQEWDPVGAGGFASTHYLNAKSGAIPFTEVVEQEFLSLGYPINTTTNKPPGDVARRTRVIPLVLAEMARRDALRTQETREWRDNDVTPGGMFCSGINRMIFSNSGIQRDEAKSV